MANARKLCKCKNFGIVAGAKLVLTIQLVQILGFKVSSRNGIIIFEVQQSEKLWRYRPNQTSRVSLVEQVRRYDSYLQTVYTIQSATEVESGSKSRGRRRFGKLVKEQSRRTIGMVNK